MSRIPVAAIFFASLLSAIEASAQTALQKIESLTANQGIYSNRIPSGSFSNAFTEVCIFSDEIRSDQNEADEFTQGGNCEPGDKGWIIERDERMAENWTNARMACTQADMRLPEPFEFQYSCFNAAVLGLNDMDNDLEWTGNSVAPYADDANRGIAANSLGGNQCQEGLVGYVGNQDSTGRTLTYRCVR